MDTAHVLVVDDDPKIRTLLRNCLEGEGMTVVEVATADDVYKVVENSKFDLITLDINLGSDDGFEVIRTIRKTVQTPIIMVSGKDDVIDRVVGLELGADDYITKPFHVREVIARIKSVLRRTQAQEPICDLCGTEPCSCKAQSVSETIQFDGMTAIPELFELWDRAGELCSVTSGDFKLLQIFLDRPKRVLSREQLMDLTGGIEWAPLDRTIDNQVARLRKKIERDPVNPKLIKTVRGVGYSFACDITRAPAQNQPKIA